MSSVEQYYDENTATFIKVGQSKESQNIHRLLWSDDVKTKEEAINFSNRLILERLPKKEDSISILDLGCGVGATLQYLDHHSNQPLNLEGITISNNQVEIGNNLVSSGDHSNSIKLIQGNFHELNNFNAKDLIYQVESFVHSDDPERLLQQVSQVLNEKGTYCLIDDFLGSRVAKTKKEHKMLFDYKEGWHIGNLHTPREIIEKASKYRLQLHEKINLTQYLNIYPLRDRLIGLATSIYKVLPVKSVYWESLRGGDALQKATKNGLIEYWLLVFKKK